MKSITFSIFVFFLLAGNCMANQSVEKSLMQLKKIFEAPLAHLGDCKKLEEILKQKIPEELCIALTYSRQLNQFQKDEWLGLFWNHNFISYEELIEQYQNKTEMNEQLHYSFFSQWGVDDSYYVNGPSGNGHSFWLEYDLQGELENPITIDNVASLVPILTSNGDYILYSLGEGRFPKGLIYVSSEGFSSMIAPSLVEYIDDVIAGLNSGNYHIGPEGVVHPHYWFDRIKLRTGKFVMDEYGDVLEIDGKNSVSR